MVNEWTSDDLPDPAILAGLIEGMKGATFTQSAVIVYAVMEHLNEHHPKPERDRWRRAHSIVEQERDQARESLRRLRAETDFDLFTVRDQLKQCRGEREQMTRDLDEWKARADKWHGAWQKSAPSPAVSRDDIDRALINVTSNAMNYPTPAQILGKDTEPLRRKCVDAICDLLCIEADQGVDPVEEKAQEIAQAIGWDWDILDDEHVEIMRSVAVHVLGQGDRHVDQ